MTIRLSSRWLIIAGAQRIVQKIISTTNGLSTTIAIGVDVVVGIVIRVPEIL